MNPWVFFGTVLLLLATLIQEGQGQGQGQDRGQGWSGWSQGQGQGQGQGQNEGQGSSSSSSSCLNQLAPCMYYLNGTGDVPDSCCDPLKSVIKSQPECICNMISNKGSREAERAGINITEAQQLPARCGQRINPLGCLSGSSYSNNSNEDSAGVNLFPSPSTIIVVAMCMIVQNLWVYHTPY